MVNVDWNVCWWKRNVLVLLFSLGISCSGICLCWETDSLRGNDPSISSLKGTKGFHSHWKTWKMLSTFERSQRMPGKVVEKSSKVHVGQGKMWQFVSISHSNLD